MSRVDTSTGKGSGQIAKDPKPKGGKGPAPSGKGPGAKGGAKPGKG